VVNTFALKIGKKSPTGNSKNVEKTAKRIETDIRKCSARATLCRAGQSGTYGESARRAVDFSAGLNRLRQIAEIV